MKFSQAFVERFANNPIVLGEYDQLKIEYGLFFNYWIQLKYLPIKNFINKKGLKTKVNIAIIDITDINIKK